MSDFQVGDRVRVQSVFNRSKLFPSVWEIVKIDCVAATLTISDNYRFTVRLDRLVKIDVVEQLGGVLQ